MKKILLSAACILSTYALFAQASANVPEDTIQLNTGWDVPDFLPANINAHSHGDLDINGTNSDLYVSTWDYAQWYHVANKGFVVRQYLAGTQVKNSTSPLYQAIRYQVSSHLPDFTFSIEPGILRHDDSTFIALTYCGDTYNPTIHDYTRAFFLQLYLWDPSLPGDPLIELNNYHYELSAGIGNSEYYWIHQDVNNLDKIAIVWEQDGGQLLTCAGEITPTGFHLGSIQPLSAIGGVAQPDVAMMTESNGSTDLYYVLTSADKTKLTVYRGNFNTLYNNPSSFSISPIFNRLATGTFGLPRIDAPDNAQYPGQENVWSCVVADHTGTNDYIFAATSSNQTGMKQQILNDGNLVSCFLCDLSPTTNPNNIYNRRPTVAFSNENLEVFYAWVFRNTGWYSNWLFLGINSVSYLSVKTTLDFNLINFPNSKYFIVPNGNYDFDNIVPAVGLSTQNDASPQLFTTFSMGTAEHFVPYFGLKTVDWNTITGYKPGENATGITATFDVDKITVAPNPFHDGFKVDLNNRLKQTYALSLFNILGQKVYEVKGNIEQLNSHIKNVGSHLNSGTYFIELKGDNGKVFRKEIVKW